MFFEAMHPSWQRALSDQRNRLQQIEGRCLEASDRLVPEQTLVMRAFETPIDQVRVLILGQDPYPTIGDAIGLSFAVDAGRKLPKSLVNIMRELRDDLGETVSCQGDLLRWRSQGVMLLNRHLTTVAGVTGSHFDFGWKEFTDAAISRLAEARGTSLVAILWGAQAQTAVDLLGDSRLIKSAHPSPLSAYRGFFGSKPFSKANQMLKDAGLEPIDWSC